MARRSAAEMRFNDVYPLLVKKAERKGRTKEEVDTLIRWLTGYETEAWKEEATYQEFFDQAPAFNPDASKIRGTICGVRIEEIEDPLMRKVRYLDKLVDDLAKGKTTEKIIAKYSGK